MSLNWGSECVQHSVAFLILPRTSTNSRHYLLYMTFEKAPHMDLYVLGPVRGRARSTPQDTFH
jgi:hypothetical protein